MDDETTPQQPSSATLHRRSIPLYSRDVARSVAFYESVFQARLDADDPSTVYPMGRTTLAIHIVDGDAPAESNDPLTPQREFEVDDPEAWIDRAIRNGA